MSSYRVKIKDKTYAAEFIEPSGFLRRVRVLLPAPAGSLRSDSWRMIHDGHQRAQIENQSALVQQVITQATAMREAARTKPQERFLGSYRTAEAPFSKSFLTKGLAFAFARREVKKAVEGVVMVQRQNAPANTEDWKTVEAWHFYADGHAERREGEAA